MVFREEAELDVDPSGFQKGIRKASQSFESLEKDVSRVGGQISTVMQFAGGFGVIAAIQQAGAAFDSFIEKLRAQGDRLAARAGVSPTGAAADLFRQAAEARADVTARPFTAAGAGVEAAFLRLGRVGLDIATLGGLLGGEDLKRGIDELTDAARDTADRLANSGEALRDAAENADLLAERAARFEQMQRQAIIPELERRAREIRVDETTLQAIITSIKQIGVEEAIKQLKDAIQAAAQNAQVNP